MSPALDNTSPDNGNLKDSGDLGEAREEGGMDFEQNGKRDQRLVWQSSAASIVNSLIENRLYDELSPSAMMTN